MHAIFRRLHTRAMDSIQASLDAEAKAKTEANRIKKKLEDDIKELEVALDYSNKANIEGQKAIKRSQEDLKDTEMAFNEVQQQRQELGERLGLTNRKADALRNEVDEANSLLELTEHGKKHLTTELEDARAAVNEMQIINDKEVTKKRLLESQIHSLRSEMDELVIHSKCNDEKIKKIMVDVLRLSDELKGEHSHTLRIEKEKKALEYRMGEVNTNLKDAEEEAEKEGRSLLSKLESRICELEIEVSTSQMKTTETTKAHQKVERSIKELEFEREEDAKKYEQMSAFVSKLQSKTKVLKEQIEEAEQIAAVNLYKYRMAQQALEETEERARIAEVNLHGMKPNF